MNIPLPERTESSDERPLTPAVTDFCRQHGIEADPKIAVRLAEKNLRPGPYKVALEGDPECDHEWVAVRADVAGPVPDALRAHDGCKTEWVALASPSGLSPGRTHLNQ